MTFFPYLAVARQHNVPYCVVLWLSDQLDAKWPAYGPMPYHVAAAWPSNSILWDGEPWAIATIAAWQIEHARRHGVAHLGSWKT
jgi:hypothetical protein